MGPYTSGADIRGVRCGVYWARAAGARAAGAWAVWRIRSTEMILTSLPPAYVPHSVCWVATYPYAEYHLYPGRTNLTPTIPPDQ
jgi:hypothetical protein